MNSGNQLPNLDKIFRDDDEQDFVPSGGSGLAAIFGLQASPLDSQSLLKQQNLKKPSTLRNPVQIVSSKTQVIIAKTVHASLLINGSYLPVGKLGVALIGNTGTKVYDIILYRSKQEHVSSVTITHDFSYHIQLNKYAYYSDGNKKRWSILFEDDDVYIEFAREIALAKYFSKDGRIDNVLYQDLSKPDTNVVAKEGDNVSIKYFITSEITQPFKSNLTMSQTMTVEISTDNNWEKTLLRSSKGLKRILFLPPSKQISLGPGFPKEKDVMLEIEIIDIKTPDEATQTSLKVTSGKASIISRMAKMGQSMLPKIPTTTTTDSEDTEDDISHKLPRHKKTESQEGGIQKKYSTPESIEEASKNVHRALKQKDVPLQNTTYKPLVSTTTFPSQWSPSQMQPNYVALDGQVYSLQPQTITPTISTVLDPGLNMLVSETRMANTELRMGMSRIADNVQKLLDKFHNFELQTITSPTKDKTALDTTLKMLLNLNVPQTVENDVQQQKNTNFIVNDGLSELNDMKCKVDVLEKELRKLKEQITELEAQKLSLTNINDDLRKSNQEFERLSKDATSKLATVRQELEETQRLNNTYAEQKVLLEDKVAGLLEQCNTLEKAANSVDVKENDVKNKEIKRIMNSIYHTLSDKFVNDSYSTDYIKSTIASTIKNVTLQVLYSTNEENISAAEVKSNKAAETDTIVISTTELDNSRLNKAVIESQKETEISENITHMSSALQDEPPPIPPIDTEDDSEWLN